MHKKIKPSDAKCTRLTMEAPVNFDAGALAESSDFEIEAYTGQVVDRWWGKLAVDVTGISASQKMPILRDHNTGDIVGHSLKSWTDGSFKVSGKFSKSTETAKEVQALAEEGFPWQASIGVKPKTVLEIKSGTSMAVNGGVVEGPAEIWIESEVYETSFVPLGADNNTSVAMLAQIEEMAQDEAEIKGDRTMEFTLEALSKEAPELLGQIRDAAKQEGLELGKAEGAEAERGRILAVEKCSLGGHEDLIETLMFDGKTTGGEAALAILKAEKTARETTLQDNADDAPAPAQHSSTDGDTGGSATNLTGEEKWKAEFEKSAELKAEFGDVDEYLAYKKVEASGKLRMTGGKK